MRYPRRDREIPYAIELAVRGFHDVIYDFDERPAAARHKGRFDYLQGYLDQWIGNSDGIEMTGGRFDIYMRAVSQIVSEYMENPNDGILAYHDPEGLEPERARHINGVVDWSHESSRSLDPEYYQFLAYSLLRHPHVVQHPPANTFDQQ